MASEVDRYCSWPGQACGYKVGHTEIVRQRDRAQAALGARYDLRDFDDAVVKGGNVPMDVLAKNVDEYIRDGEALRAAPPGRASTNSRRASTDISRSCDQKRSGQSRRPIGDSSSSLTSSWSGRLASASSRNSRTPRRNTRVMVS